MKGIAVFISGGGTNLQGLIDKVHNGDGPGRISVVISNEPDAYGLERAEKAGIPTEVVSHKGVSRQEFEARLLETLSEYDVGLICLAGWMRIMTPDFFDHAPPMMNIHPALLPSFGGKGMYGHHVHEAVLRSGARFSGPTVHFVTPDVDAGPIIVQRVVPVMDDDTPETLAARVLEQEHIAFPEAVQLFLEGHLEVLGNRVIRK